MFDKMNSCLAATKENLIGVVQNENNARLKDVCSYIESGLNAQPQTSFSTCSGAPGWNLKYKKNSKAICTIYPEKNEFYVLITFNNATLEKFDIVSGNFSKYTQNLVKSTQLHNGTKWFMVKVDSGEAAQDVKKLIELKFS